MTNTLFGLVTFIIIFCVGVILGISTEEKITHERCVKANPTVPVGEIQAFCNERLYKK